MIRKETIYIGETPFIRTYSDRGVMIHGGEPESDYPESFDPVGVNRTYTETTIPIDDGEELTANEILAILLGEGDEE